MTPRECLEQWESLPMKARNGRLAKVQAKKVGMKSMHEVLIAAMLDDRELVWQYEPEIWEYTFGVQRYAPDFLVQSDKGPVYLEGKGKMTQAVRRKMLAVKKCNPDRNLKIVFERANNKIRRGSKTTYAKWSENHGFDWSEKELKEGWFE